MAFFICMRYTYFKIRECEIMKKLLFFLFLFMLPVVVFGRCYNIPVCSNGTQTALSFCDNETVRVSMNIYTPTLSEVKAYNLDVDPNAEIVTGNGEFYIPDVPGFVFDGYYYNGSKVLEFAGLRVVPITYDLVGRLCVYDDNGDWTGEREKENTYTIKDEFEQIVLESKWRSVDMIVHYHNNGGSGPSSGVASGDNNQVGLSVPTRTNYTFTGWYYDEALTKKVESDKIIELDFETINDMNYGLNTGIKSGYKDLNLYAGWALSSSGSVSGSGSVSSCPMGVATARIDYYTNGGDSIPSSIISSMLLVNNNLPLPVKAGYIFDGWYYDEELTDKVNTTLISEVKYQRLVDEKGCTKTDVVNLYAKWTDTDSKNNALDQGSNSGNNDSSKDNDDGKVNAGNDDMEDSSDDSKNPDTGAFATSLSVIVIVSICFILLCKRYYKFSRFPKI